MTTRDIIGPSENLGQGIFSSDDEKKAKNGNVRYHVFLEKRGQNKISVDRLDKTSSENATKVADQVASKRGRKFYGWAVVKASFAAQSDRKLEASPLPDNPHHAEIILPDSTIEDREEQVRHAQALADISVWCSRDSAP